MSDDEKLDEDHLRGGQIAKMLSSAADHLRDLMGADKVLIIALKATRSGDDAVISGTAGLDKGDMLPALNYCIKQFASDTAVMISPKADA